ncbi:MAG: hypothetical protein LBN12_05730 [Clostridiales Family XIII bacterium]|jgi:hypothetical protein|nr:hypothetical protein [Clostridiales Family XIII bacterium]
MKSFITFLLAALLVSMAFAAQPSLFAYASNEDADPAAPPAEEGFEVTNYTIKRADGQINTGSILTGDAITVTVDILDKRHTKGEKEPKVALNTASFSLYEEGNIEYRYNSKKPTKFTVIFYNAIYSGTGNSFNIELSYPGSAIEVTSKDLIFNQCVPYTAPETPSENVEIKGTGFVLKDARYADGQTVYAGEAFTLSATILATNGAVPVENVTVSFAPPEKLTLAEGSSIAYVGTMSPGQTVPVSVRLLPGANIEEGTYTVDINISGINQKTGIAVDATAKVSIPVLQPERFEIFNAQLPSDLTAGMDDGLGYASIALVNKGKGTVANVSVEIVGTGLTTDEGKQYIGNVAAGEQKSSDFNLHAEAPGQVDGMVVVTYENARGEEKTIERGFAVNVMEAPMMEPDPGTSGDEMPAEKTGPPKWIWAAAIVAAAVIVTIVLTRRARKKKKAREEEFLDEDDDDL